MVSVFWLSVVEDFFELFYGGIYVVGAYVFGSEAYSFDVAGGVTVIGTYDTTNESLIDMKVDLLV